MTFDGSPQHVPLDAPGDGAIPVSDRHGRAFAAFAWGALGYSLLVILWGYYLRVSESGDGCGTDWPLCHGSVVPSSAEFPTWVEYIHRTSSGIVLLVVAAMVVWAFRVYPRGHAVRRAAGASLVFTISESLFGAMLVIFGLVATDVSTARILVRPFHVTNTFLLMASLALTAWWAHRGIERVPRLGRPTRAVALPAVLGVLFLAWSGSWTGLASTAFPAASVSDGIGQYFSPEHVLIYLRLIHPVVAIGAAVLLFRLVARARRLPDPSIRFLTFLVGGLTIAQIVAGPATIVLLQPPGLRVLHLFLADLLWIALLLLTSALLEAAASPSTGRSGAGIMTAGATESGSAAG